MSVLPSTQTSPAFKSRRGLIAATCRVRTVLALLIPLALPNLSAAHPGGNWPITPGLEHPEHDLACTGTRHGYCGYSADQAYAALIDYAVADRGLIIGEDGEPTNMGGWRGNIHTSAGKECVRLSTGETVYFGPYSYNTKATSDTQFGACSDDPPAFPDCTTAASQGQIAAAVGFTGTGGQRHFSNAVPHDALIQKSVVTSSYDYTQCSNTGIDAGEGTTLYCVTAVSATQTLTTDGQIRTTESLIGISQGSESSLECTDGLARVSNQIDTPVDLSSDNVTTKIEKEYNADGTVTESTSETSELNTYDPDSDTTEKCFLTRNITTASGGTAEISGYVDCERVNGDDTWDQLGSGGNVLTDANGNQVYEGNNNPVTATGRTGASIQDGVCVNPNGCEDFAEILVTYDESGTDSTILGWIENIDGLLQAETDELTSVSNDPGSLGSSLDPSGLNGLGGMVPGGGGACQTFTLNTMAGELQIDCEVFSSIQLILTFALWAAVGLYLRQVFLRPATVRA